jgi:DNA-binding transcriptional ArsR family regulator/anti-sigma regulatory factor (Ser/Thr protein kinase)
MSGTREAILRELANGPASSGDLGSAIGVSRQAVLNHLTELADEGIVARSGAGRAVRWELAFDLHLVWARREDLAPLEEDVLWSEVEQALGDRWTALRPPVQRRVRWCATEMLNNAIDHSEGRVISASVRTGPASLTLRVADDGIGVYRRVRDTFDLPDNATAVEAIAKGRQTTAPEEHSGQGIFFSSRIADRFVLDSDGTAWTVEGEDQTLGATTPVGGTRVTMDFDTTSDRTTEEVFDRHTEPDDLEFTITTLRLGRAGPELVSRSEAKRLVTGLEEFRVVQLDFSEVTGVGQGFVDELFRVWARRNPDTELRPQHMNPEVAFMVERGLTSASVTHRYPADEVHRRSVGGPQRGDFSFSYVTRHEARGVVLTYDARTDEYDVSGTPADLEWFDGIPERRG